jgi:hypothetical protein
MGNLFHCSRFFLSLDYFLGRLFDEVVKFAKQERLGSLLPKLSIPAFPKSESGETPTRTRVEALQYL